MMSTTRELKMIPVEKISILNLRSRNKRKFGQIVENIGRIGLKKPITVCLRGDAKEEESYDLVCGQGRLEAFIRLGQKLVPAIIIEVSMEDRLLMGLAENIVRRDPLTLESLRQLQALKDKGYSVSDIAQKTDLTTSYVKDVLKLFEAGEEQLLRAVEAGKIPISIAASIAVSSDQEVQEVLQAAYEKNQLRGGALARARRLIEQRQLFGKKGKSGRRKDKVTSSESVVAAMKVEADRQSMLVRKAEACEAQLLIVVNALRQLCEDNHFLQLLQSEGLDSIPRQVAQGSGGNTHGSKS